MLDTLRTWILTICGTALIWGVGMGLTGERGRRTLGVAGGFAAMAAMLSIVGNADALGIGVYADRYREEAAGIVEDAEARARRETRFIIEEKCEAYIMDKADELGAALQSVTVTAEWSGEGFWYPDRCALEGVESRALSRAIEADLGIGPDRQSWSTEDGR